MSTMKISLPESLKDFVERKVKDGTYGTNSQYVRALIRKDLERERLRLLLLKGAQSPRSEWELQSGS
ncbi:type II toxin-antitoxin system ParD family antitoxin [Ignatzschineria indica]|uniref:type II toxin-antitoxin system ParD family antitoxin n=1 Tax=Ignatzschineria indica TaxID=472583 RepID=UPI002576A06A|nr:type II toxin-antitoxin system ParD family antitoxin [Ignatzschineria indica]MDM1546089.1 type II toxin-antitoxin system ParD family antitoxin [Ignatzschineria indica]